MKVGIVNSMDAVPEHCPVSGGVMGEPEAEDDWRSSGVNDSICVRQGKLRQAHKNKRQQQQQAAVRSGAASDMSRSSRFGILGKVVRMTQTVVGVAGTALAASVVGALLNTVGTQTHVVPLIVCDWASRLLISYLCPATAAVRDPG